MPNKVQVFTGLHSSCFSQKWSHNLKSCNRKWCKSNFGSLLLTFSVSFSLFVSEMYVIHES